MIYLISILVGLTCGSFANVCILRLPNEESVWFPGSRCPACRKTLRAWQNVPLVSFCVLRGHCAYCRHRISWQYPFVELLMACLFLMNSYLYSDLLSKVIVIDLLSFYLLTLSIIDYRHRIIPDELSLSLWFIGVLMA